MEIEFDRKFCVLLEYELCRYFESNYTETTKGFWCDGVIFEGADERTASFKIFTGKTGQTEYQLTLVMGEKLLSRYKKSLPREGLSLDENDVRIDVGNKSVVIECEED
ncbi:MAG: hypothetical protein LBK58_07155 [Prevotellaceae bacterium]|nr:hypothetical protein [Prevotellaceae bacterium]